MSNVLRQVRARSWVKDDDLKEFDSLVKYLHVIKDVIALKCTLVSQNKFHIFYLNNATVYEVILNKYMLLLYIN